MRRYVFLALLAAMLLPATIAKAETAAEKQMAQRIGNQLKQSGKLRDYRIGVKFQFDTPEDKEAVRKYCEEMAIRRDPKVVLAEITEQRITAIARILVNVCLGVDDSLEKCLALNPAPQELAAAFTRAKAYDPTNDWYTRVGQVRADLAKLLTASVAPQKK